MSELGYTVCEFELVAAHAESHRTKLCKEAIGEGSFALLLIDLYRSGQLRLDEMVSKTYALDEINEAFAALERGENARGVIAYE